MTVRAEEAILRVVGDDMALELSPQLGRNVFSQVPVRGGRRRDPAGVVVGDVVFVGARGFDESRRLSQYLRRDIGLVYNSRCRSRMGNDFTVPDDDDLEVLHIRPAPERE